MQQLIENLQLTQSQISRLKWLFKNIEICFAEEQSNRTNNLSALSGSISPLIGFLLETVSKNNLSQSALKSALQIIKTDLMPPTSKTRPLWSKLKSLLIQSDNGLPSLIAAKVGELKRAAGPANEQTDEELRQEVEEIILPSRLEMATLNQLLIDIDPDDSFVPQANDINPILKAMEDNHILTQHIKTKKYFVSLLQDKDIANLARKFQEKVSNYSINRPESQTELLAIVDEFENKIQIHVAKHNGRGNDDLALCRSAFTNVLKHLKISPITNLDNLEDLCCFIRALEFYLERSARCDAFLDKLLPNIADRRAIDIDHQSDLLKLIISPYSNGLRRFFDIFCDSKFRQREQELSRVIYVSDQPRAHPRNKKVFQEKLEKSKKSVELYVQQNQSLKKKITHAIRSNNFLHTIKDNNSKTKKSPSLHELDRYARDNNLKSRSEAEQITFKRQIDRSRFTLSATELDLLSKATKLNLRKIVPIDKRNPNALSYDDALKAISTEIEKRNKFNSSFIFRIMPFLPRVRTSYLKAAYSYIAFHRAKYLSLQPNSSLEDQDQPVKVSEFRSSFSQFAEQLSNVFETNTAIKQLSSFFQKKLDVAKELETHIPVWNNVDPKKQSFDNLQGCLFQPKKVDLRDQRFRSLEKFFLPDEESQQKARQINEKINYINPDNSIDTEEFLHTISLLDLSRSAFLKTMNLFTKVDQLALTNNVELANTTCKELSKIAVAFQQCTASLKYSNDAIKNALISILKAGQLRGDYVQLLKKEVEDYSAVLVAGAEINEQMKNWDPKFINYVKNNNVCRTLANIAKELVSSNNPKGVLEGHIKLLTLAETNLAKLPTGSINELVKTAKENVKAMTYLKDRAELAAPPVKRSSSF